MVSSLLVSAHCPDRGNASAPAAWPIDAKNEATVIRMQFLHSPELFTLHPSCKVPRCKLRQ